MPARLGSGEAVAGAPSLVGSRVPSPAFGTGWVSRADVCPCQGHFCGTCHVAVGCPGSGLGSPCFYSLPQPYFCPCLPFLSPPQFPPPSLPLFLSRRTTWLPPTAWFAFFTAGATAPPPCLPVCLSASPPLGRKSHSESRNHVFLQDRSSRVRNLETKYVSDSLWFTVMYYIKLIFHRLSMKFQPPVTR